jgi:hypothetical protein
MAQTSHHDLHDDEALSSGYALSMAGALTFINDSREAGRRDLSAKQNTVFAAYTAIGGVKKVTSLTRWNLCFKVPPASSARDFLI